MAKTGMIKALKKGLPFDVRIPNKTTLETFKKTDAGIELNTYKTLEGFDRKKRCRR